MLVYLHAGDEETKKLRDEIQKNFFMDSVDVLLAIFLPRSQQQQTPMKPSLARAGSIKAIYVSREILCISTDGKHFENSIFNFELGSDYY